MSSAAPLVSRETLALEVRRRLKNHAGGAVLAFRAAPSWPADLTLALEDGRVARVAPCRSTLAFWDQVVGHSGDEVLVVLTDRTRAELGDGLISRIHRQELFPIDPWQAVVEVFGMTRPEQDLVNLGDWAAESLIAAQPASGWPKLPGTVLTRSVALRQLAGVRFSIAAQNIDADALLTWSSQPSQVAAFLALGDAERAGLGTWLTGEFGPAVRPLFSLVEAGHAAQVLALGLSGAALAAVGDDRAQGRYEQFTRDLDEPTLTAFWALVRAHVDRLLDSKVPAELLRGRAALDGAENLLLGTFKSPSAAELSDLLPAGLEARIAAVGAALTTKSLDPEQALLALEAHRLADRDPGRVQRARMAVRLQRWTLLDEDGPTDVGNGIRRQVSDWGWVDRALAQVWAGANTQPALQAAYKDVYQRASARRRQLDKVFADRLSASGGVGAALAVEDLLSTVITPLRRGPAPLLVVLDGMSAAVAVELAEELRPEEWVEYDPLGGTGPASRRGILAALPTVTSVSRASLFAGELCVGNDSTERKAFTKRYPKAALFHKGSLYGEAGEMFDSDLREALDDSGKLVAVVINTVDDALDRGREGADPSWKLAHFGLLHTLLQQARRHQRPVVITSDHGHILQREGRMLAAADSASARHRTGSEPPADGEVELAGTRVMAPGNRVVALWDPELRYKKRKAGYHGGASLAEVTIPLLALMPAGVDAPTDWVALDVQPPVWWSGPGATRVAATAQQPVTPSVQPAPEPQSVRTPLLLGTLLSSELFQALTAQLPRGLTEQQLHAALSALLEAGGVLPAVVAAQRAGVAASRAGGLLTMVQRVMNVDGYPVLEIIDNGRTASLNRQQLIEQFGLSE
ncbi:BREX-2 system phosphatase PglZ [Longispora sp. NPDC051575]|uniref:BREX-2 system phosphatase PglZ n=1 Tax=Longispora sp. NPDC051575 TaxID=3154943 RepID=UPI00343C5D7D